MASSSNKKRKQVIESVETEPKHSKDMQGFVAHINPCASDQTFLSQWYDSLNEFWKNEFSSTYKYIMDMVHFPLDWDFIKATLRFWSPHYRCFAFEDFDMTPTVEEYSEMLGYVSDSNKEYYVHYCPDIRARPTSAFANLFQITTEEAEAVIKGGDDEKQTISIHELKKFSWKRCQEERNDIYFIRGLALAVYSVVVFPTKLNKVDKSIIPLVAAISMNKNHNPTSAILAETFNFFNYCRKNKKASPIFFCAPLFQTWAYSHLFPVRETKFESSFSQNLRPIRDAVRPKKDDQRKIHEWVEFLDRLTEGNVVFRAKWMAPGCVFLAPKGSTSCCVPLIGPKTCISYAPCLVMRQFGTKQDVPRLPDDPCKIEFTWWGGGKTWDDQLNEVQNQREIVTLDGNEGFQHLNPTDGYKEWLKNRWIEDYFIKKKAD